MFLLVYDAKIHASLWQEKGKTLKRDGVFPKDVEDFSA
jgi:hypothetical protein